MPCASRALGPTGEFISMRSLPSSPGYLCEHAVQRAPRQGHLEIVAAETARAFENGIGSRAESGRACRCVDQPLLGLRYPPRPMRQPAEGQPGSADLAARAIDDCGDGNQCKGVGSTIADLAIDL